MRIELARSLEPVDTFNTSATHLKLEVVSTLAEFPRTRLRLLTVDVNVDSLDDLALLTCDDVRRASRVVWFENLGRGAFSSEKAIEDIQGKVITEIRAMDLDSDELPDLIVTHETFEDMSFFWLKNGMCLFAALSSQGSSCSSAAR